jgi:ABC-type nitrate/sulfonate/bicarbonate transport system substrate-binding protein
MICSLVIAAFLRAAFPALAQETVRVAVSNFSASYISMYIASTRGYYAEEGMAVEIILMAGLTSTRALIGNSVEFGSAVILRPLFKVQS